MEKHRPKRVLVIEDNIALARVLKFNLEQAGMEVRLAENGLEACEVVEHESFDLIITDEQMPMMSGQEFCRRYRATPAGRHVPIILLTAKQFELDKTRLAEDLQINTILGKPFSPRAMVRVVSELFSEASRGAPV
jgi:two-component system alkaline phosphatase synthesis response regulator PhoP